MHPNEKLLRDLDAAFEKGDVDTMFAVFTDDAVIHVAGRSSLAGKYRGKQSLQELFGRFMEAIGASAQFSTHDILANDEHGIMLQETRAEKGGQSIEIRSIAVLHFRDGKISEMWTVDEDPYTADPFYG